jgi:hypothetical protein
LLIEVFFGALLSQYCCYVCRPSDAAIAAFLKTMGLTLDDLKQRPLLAKKIVAQHTILKHNVREQELFAQGNTRIVDTMAGRPNELLFQKLPSGSVTVRNVARVHTHTHTHTRCHTHTSFGW